MKIRVVKDSKAGVTYLKKLLYSLVDSKTALFLSGGKTPKDAYSQLVLEQKINPGAVAMVDEREGKPMHENSNEKMISETGFLSYLEKNEIPFYSILRFGTAYNEQVKYLLEHFSKKAAIMGIGEDGHTASLPAGVKSKKLKVKSYVINIDNFPIEPKERTTLTFRALSEMDLLIILAFGKNKKEALRKMFKKGSIDEIPARFYTRKDIVKKTILITDQKI